MVSAVATLLTICRRVTRVNVNVTTDVHSQGVNADADESRRDETRRPGPLDTSDEAAKLVPLLLAIVAIIILSCSAAQTRQAFRMQQIIRIHSQKLSCD
ncbi:hypothetical protein ACLKA6_018731 [Drosophila palustris]